MAKVLNMRGRGGVVPPGAVYIGRRMARIGLAASKWANPFTIGLDGTRDEVIEKYRAHLLSRPDLMAALPELRGATSRAGAHPSTRGADRTRERLTLTRAMRGGDP